MRLLPLAAAVLHGFLISQEPTVPPPAADTPATVTTAAAATAAPHVRIETFGPDGWRMRLGPTNLGGLLASEPGRALWQPWLEPMLAVWRDAAGDESAFAASRQRWQDYGGRVRIGIWGEAGRDLFDPRTASVAVVLHGDGRADLESLAQDLRAALYRAVPGEWGERTVAGEVLRVRSGGVVATDPRVHGDRLAFGIDCAGDLATAVARLRRFADEPTPAARPDAPAFVLQADMGRICNGLLAVDDDDRRMLAALGFLSLDGARFAIGTAGPRVRVDAEASFTAAGRGLFAAALPEAAEVSPLVRLVPADAALWSVDRFDLAAAYRAVLEALAALDMGTVEELQAGIVEENGVDPLDDVLAHMTDEIVFAFGSVSDDEQDEEDLRLDRANWTLVFRLRDEAAFAKGLGKLLTSARPFLSREASEEQDGATVHRYGNMLGYDVWMSTGNGLFTIAGGRDAEASTAALHARAVAARSGPPPATPEHLRPFEELRHWLPAGGYGRGAGHPTWLTGVPSESWLWVLRELVPGGDLVPSAPDDPETRAALRGLLRTHGLDRTHTATGRQGRTWRWSMFW